jgi:hypothetical protein
MGRVLFLTVLIYCYGDTGFDGHRPLALDRPLREFSIAPSPTPGATYGAFSSRSTTRCQEYRASHHAPAA